MKFKQVLAGLLVGAMVVTSAPVSGLGALSALAAADEEDSRATLDAPSISVTAPADGKTPADAVSLDHTTSPQIFEDVAADSATLTTENLTVTKETVTSENGEEEIQAFSGKITAANDGTNNSKFDISGNNTQVVIKLKIKPNKITGKTWLIGKMDNQYGIQIDGDKKQINFYSENPLVSGEQWTQWPDIHYSFTDDFWGQWHEIVAVYTGSKMQLFVDGNAGELTSGRPESATWKADSNSVFTLGYNVAKEASLTSPYSGQFADVEMYTYDGTDTIGENAAYADINTALAKMTKIFDLNAQAEDENAAPNYTVESTNWTSDGESVDTFEEDGVYDLEVVLKAKDGYKFTEDNKPTDISLGEDETIGLKTAEVSKDGTTMTLICRFGGSDVKYEPLDSEVLTGHADSEETVEENSGAQGKAELAVDGDEDTYWHSQYSAGLGGNNVVLGNDDTKQNKNNNYYIDLGEGETTYTVSQVTYVPRTKDGLVTGNGYITKCNVYTSSDTEAEDSEKEWTLAGTGEWTYTDANVKRSVVFDKVAKGVTSIKIEVLGTEGEAGNNKFINAAEFGVVGAEETEIGEGSVLGKPDITVTAPVKDAEPEDAKTDENWGYEANSEWTGKDGVAVTKFEAGQEYTLTLKLTATDSNTFDKTSIPETIHVGDEKVDVEASKVTISPDGKTMTLIFTFSVPADAVQYAKLTGLTGEADSEELTGEPNGNGPIVKALDGKTDTYWHTNWKDDTAPKAATDGTKLTGNNNYVITLAKPSTVTAVTYVPRNGYERSSGKVNNGAIEQCNVYVTTDGTTWKPAGTIGESNAWSYVNQGAAGADQNFVEKTVTFDKAYADVTKVKIEAIKTAGPQPNEFINAAEFGVIGKEDEGAPTVSAARKALAEALEAAKAVEAEEKYTAESYATYKAALATANAITEASTDEEVQAAADELKDAIDNLEKKPEVPDEDKTEITAPTISYTAPEAGEYAKAATVGTTAEAAHHETVADQAEKPATLEKADSSVETTVAYDTGVWGFTGRLIAPVAGTNNDKFDISGTTPMAMRLKVKLPSNSNNVQLIGKMDYQYGVQVNGSTKKVILYCCDTNSEWPEVSYSFDDTFWDTWHDILVVYTGTGMQLYVDGNAATPTSGRPNAAAGYTVTWKSYNTSVFGIGYNAQKTIDKTENGVILKTLDQIGGKVADIQLYSGTDYTNGLTKDYEAVSNILDTVTPNVNITVTPYDVKTTWAAGDEVLAGGAKFASGTSYTATTVFTAHEGFTFAENSKPSVAGATVTVSDDGKTMTVTKTFEKTAEVTCSCALSEITGVEDQTVALDVADSKSVKLEPKATATPCRVDGHNGTVVYTYAVKTAGNTGATVTTDGTVTVTAAGTAKITVTATLSREGEESIVKTKDVTLTVTSDKASAVEKNELQNMVNDVADKLEDEENYTAESYEELKKAVAEANKLLKDSKASKDQIKAAKDAIETAKNGLVTKRAAAKKKLGDLLDEVAKLDKNLYTVESYNAMVVADEEAVAAYNKADATEEELTKVYNALTKAQDKLVFKLDQAKNEAAKALEAAKAIYEAGQKDYDDASWTAFGNAYNALKNADEKANAATLTTLIKALTKAQGALTVKKDETPKPVEEVKLDAPAVKAVKAKAAKGGVTVTVTIEPVKDAASYDVYRVVKGKATKVGTTAAGKTAVTDTTAIRGASYYAVAVSADGKTVSKAGAAVAVKLAKAPKIKKASAGTKTVKLTWKKAKGTKVVVYRSTKKNSGYKKVATSKKGVASLVNKKLKAGKTYYYKIATVKGKTVSAMSKAKRVKTKK